MITPKGNYRTTKGRLSDARCIFAIMFALACVQLIETDPTAAASEKASPSKEALRSIDKLINANRFADAAKRSREELKRFPRNAELHGDLALAALYGGDFKTAQDYAEKALKLDGRNHEAHWVLTNVYSAQGKVEESMRELSLSMQYRSTKPCKPCQKKSKEALELLKSIKQ